MRGSSHTGFGRTDYAPSDETQDRHKQEFCAPASSTLRLLLPFPVRTTVRINRTFLAACRTVHIYLTMLGLFVMLGFGVTGFTVNHEEWFGATTPRVREVSGRTPRELLEKKDSLHIVEHLRETLHITAAMTGFDDLGDKISVGFKSPNEIWEVEIEKADGKTAARCESFNTIALINNLHRGRYSGPVWSWVIDVSALLILLASITGFILWLALPKRRKLGIASIALGTLATILIFLLLVPGRGQLR